MSRVSIKHWFGAAAKQPHRSLLLFSIMMSAAATIAIVLSALFLEFNVEYLTIALIVIPTLAAIYLFFQNSDSSNRPASWWEKRVDEAPIRFIYRSRKRLKVITSDFDAIFGPEMQALNISSFQDFCIYARDSFDVIHFYCQVPLVPQSDEFGQFLKNMNREGKSIIYTFTEEFGYSDFAKWLSETETNDRVSFEGLLGLSLADRLSGSFDLPSTHYAFLYKVTDQGALKLVHALHTAIERESGFSKLYAFLPEKHFPRLTRFSLDRIRWAFSYSVPDLDAKLSERLQRWQLRAGVTITQIDKSLMPKLSVSGPVTYLSADPVLDEKD